MQREEALAARRGALSTGLVVLIALLVIVLLFGGCAVTQYNGLVSKREAVDAAWSQVEGNYKHRSELTGQLVETVKGAASFESETLQDVIEARAKATSLQIDVDSLDDAEKVKAYLEAQEGVGAALARLLAVAESYPDLKAVAAFRDLQVQLEGMANRINVARIDYIEAVKSYNTAVRRFPGNVVAGMTGHETLPQFSAAESDLTVPEIDFGGGKE